ncbi:MAG: hypothetical protein RML93_00480 [Anaerolineales bacterium]|nr:hypothetical protein [Anaerolineales bacterium]MCS7246846.1 hypothetical protein [Anaerolineales bacterium]MDW8160656.1 hypothetical protein [Anaerolineales bacterium]MDW8445746.1 hypothetical protein [Anaerolineales bacterium]
MDRIREYLKRPPVLVGGGFLVGLILGWFVIGWGIWPVQWTDAAPRHLRQDLKLEYLSMAVDSYILTQNAELAKRRFAEFGEEGEELLREIEKQRPEQAANVAAFRLAVTGQAALPVPTPVEGGVVPTQEETQPAARGGASVIRNLLLVFCVAFSLLLVGAAVFFFLRTRKPALRPSGHSTSQKPFASDVGESWGRTARTASAAEPPMMQFMASYKYGDDLFDDSFSIDSQSGEFLGECGVNICETIGVGEPKKVTAFEVWLFDKSDIQTVTKVLMSEHAYNDEATYQRLAVKGEPVLLQPGLETVLETRSLQLLVRVVDMAYGDGAMPPSSYFTQLVLELAVWSKM